LTRKIRNSIGRAIALALAALIIPAPAKAQGAAATAGRIKTSSGRALIVRDGRELAATPGTAVLQGDVLRTGSNGQLSVMLRDNSRLSLAAGTEVAVREFAFSPAEGRLAMFLRAAYGVMAFISGRIAQLSPDSVRIETPKLVVAMRGVHVLFKADPL
jgi:hypothetical protein